MTPTPNQTLLTLILAAAILAPPLRAQDQQPANPVPTTDTQATDESDPQPADTTNPEDDPYSPENYVKPEIPGLEPGDHAPNITLLDHDDTPVNLKDIWTQRPLIVVFIRGGWCTQCVRTMQNWNPLLDRLEDDGASLIVITPVSPDNILPLIDLYECEFPIFSDRDGRIGRAFKVRNIIDQPTQRRFLNRHKLDLSTIHADGTWDVPAHSTFIIDTEGIVRVRWAFWSSMMNVQPTTVIDAFEMLELPQPAPTPNPSEAQDPDNQPNDTPQGETEQEDPDG